MKIKYPNPIKTKNAKILIKIINPLLFIKGFVVVTLALGLGV
jgi:hypothetical protein